MFRLLAKTIGIGSGVGGGATTAAAARNISLVTFDILSMPSTPQIVVPNQLEQRHLQPRAPGFAEWLPGHRLVPGGDRCSTSSCRLRPERQRVFVRHNRFLRLRAVDVQSDQRIGHAASHLAADFGFQCVSWRMRIRISATS